jgi:hypothetical protein
MGNALCVRGLLGGLVLALSLAGPVTAQSEFGSLPASLPGVVLDPAEMVLERTLNRDGTRSRVLEIFNPSTGQTRFAYQGATDLVVTDGVTYTPQGTGTRLASKLARAARFFGGPILAAIEMIWQADPLNSSEIQSCDPTPLDCADLNHHTVTTTRTHWSLPCFESFPGGITERVWAGESRTMGPAGDLPSSDPGGQNAAWRSSGSAIRDRDQYGTPNTHGLPLCGGSRFHNAYTYRYQPDDRCIAAQTATIEECAALIEDLAPAPGEDLFGDLDPTGCIPFSGANGVELNCNGRDYPLPVIEVTGDNDTNAPVVVDIFPDLPFNSLPQDAQDALDSATTPSTGGGTGPSAGGGTIGGTVTDPATGQTFDVNVDVDLEPWGLDGETDQPPPIDTEEIDVGSMLVLPVLATCNCPTFAISAEPWVDITLDSPEFCTAMRAIGQIILIFAALFAGFIIFKGV